MCPTSNVTLMLPFNKKKKTSNATFENVSYRFGKKLSTNNTSYSVKN